MAAQDPDEPFDLVDAQGAPLGRVKPRAEVHRDGDWHRAMHLWIVTPDDVVLLQERSLAKDTHPGLVDVSVAGHLRAGEGVTECLRESDEEVGVRVDPARVVTLGRRWYEKRFVDVIDREVQEVLAVVMPLDAAALVPHDDEVAALMLAPRAALLALELGAVDIIDAVRVTPAQRAPHAGVLRREMLVPDPGGYRVAALRALGELRATGSVTPFEMR